jgi:hypothetical protein
VIQEAAMMPYQSNQLFEVERPKSRAEQLAADVRRGELAAAISRTISATSGRMRAVVQRLTRSPSRLSRALARGLAPTRPRRELDDRVNPMRSGRASSLPREESVTR